MKIAYIILILIAFHYKVYAQNDNPFAEMKYDSIVIYDFEPITETSAIVIEENKLFGSIKKRKVLTHNESFKLTGILGLTSSYGEYTALCYDPHLGIVYYKNGIAIEKLTICMDCNILFSSIDIPNQKQGRHDLPDGTFYYDLDGMSQSLIMHLNNLLKKYKFSHTLKD